MPEKILNAGGIPAVKAKFSLAWQSHLSGICALIIIWKLCLYLLQQYVYTRVQHPHPYSHTHQKPGYVNKRLIDLLRDLSAGT